MVHVLQGYTNEVKDIVNLRLCPTSPSLFLSLSLLVLLQLLYNSLCPGGARPAGVHRVPLPRGARQVRRDPAPDAGASQSLTGTAALITIVLQNHRVSQKYGPG